MLQSKTTLGHMAALLTAVIWGTTFIATKVLLRSFTPIEILFIRFVVGYLSLLLIKPQMIKFSSWKEERLFIAAGICGVTLYFLLENIALTMTNASNVGVITSIAPIVTAILASKFFNGEKIQSCLFVGAALAMVGIVLISFNGSVRFETHPLGDFLATLSPITWAVYSLLTRKISDLGYHVVVYTRRVFFYGILFMIPALFFMEFRLGPERFTQPVNLLNLIYLGFGASALCFVVWNWAVKTLGAVKTSVYIYMVPVISVIASALILGERITIVSVCATGLILLGLLISEGTIRLPARKSKEEPSSVTEQE